MHTGSRENDTFEFENEDELDDKTIESEIERMLEESDDDFSKLDEFVSKHKNSYARDLADFAFRAAIQSGNIKYVDHHAADFNLNDGDGYSTYLDEADDKEMQEVLMDHGALRSWDDYEDCRFAMETVNGEIIAFDSDFQQEVFRKYKRKYKLSNARICEIISEGFSDDESDRDVESDLETMGISVDDEEFSFDTECADNGYELMELLKDLGWDCEFEGNAWSLQPTGVYFIK